MAEFLWTSISSSVGLEISTMCYNVALSMGRAWGKPCLVLSQRLIEARSASAGGIFLGA